MPYLGGGFHLGVVLRAEQLPLAAAAQQQDARVEGEQARAVADGDEAVDGRGEQLPQRLC